MAHRPNQACHLFLYGLQAKNDSYILKWLKGKKKIRMPVSLSAKITWDSNFTVHKVLLEHIHGQFCMCCLRQCWEVTTETLWPTKPKICCLILYRIYLLTPYSRGKKRLPYGIYWVKTMWNLQRHEELFGATGHVNSDVEMCIGKCWVSMFPQDY